MYALTAVQRLQKIMPITIDRLTDVITIPQSELSLISGTFYAADTSAIRLSIKAIEASEEGIVFPDTHVHNTSVTLFGVTYARLIEYIAPYSITFSPDIQYTVRLDGSNNNMGDVQAGILNQNQVQVIPTNSAGLIDLEILTSSAYQGLVVFNTARGQPGTAKPIGTFERPSDNMDDALAIAVKEGLPKFVLTEAVTLTQDFSLGYLFMGSLPTVLLNVDNVADVSGCSFKNLTITGELDGLNSIDSCGVQTVTNLSGLVIDSSFSSTAAFNGDTLVRKCNSLVVGAGSPVFTTGTHNIIFRDWHGSLTIDGMTAGTLTVEVYGGSITINSNCVVAGGIFLRGVPTNIINNAADNVIIDQTEGRKIDEVHKRLDLDSDLPNTYADDGSVISNDEFTLTKVDNGDGTFDIVKT